MGVTSATGEQAISEALTHGRAILKYISANDVDLTGGHQYGFYLPKPVWEMFTAHPPEKGENKESVVRVLWQDGRETDSRIKWYGDKSRNEYRLTRFGSNFPFRTFDNVGDLLVLVPISYERLSAFVLDREDDIDAIQEALGVELVPRWAAYDRGRIIAETPEDCVNKQFRAFAAAHEEWPNTATFTAATITALKKCNPDFLRWTADARLVALIEREYELFRLVERQLCSREIVRTFKDVDDFLDTANTIANRRKSRAGRSLENHVGNILRDAGVQFEARARIDGRVEPDILIPSRDAYNDPSFPAEKLRIIGVKTTCKDRWRQVLNEGKRVKRKHILTMQPGISATQLTEMRDADLTLVVPKALHKEYPRDTGCPILTVEEFIASIPQGTSGGLF